MNQISFSSTIALVISLLVLLQGWSILRGAGKVEDGQKKQIRGLIGWLTVLFATLGMAINILFLSTDIAISPEFGVFILQGNWSRLFFAFCVLGLIFCISLGWELARLREGWPLRGTRIYLLGVGVGLISILILFKRINASGINETPIYLYDIWWPPLLLWLTVGFTDMALTILRVKDEVVRGLTAISAVLVLIIAAIDKSPLPDFAHPWTRLAWALAASLLLIPIWYEVRKPAQTMKAKGETPRQSAIVSHLKQNVNLQEFFQIERQQQYTLLTLGLIVAGVVLLLSSPSLIGPTPGIIVALIGWGLMTEIITDGWFHDLYRDYRSGQWFAEHGSLVRASTTLRDGVRNTGERLGKIFSLPSNWTAVIKLLILMIFLVALNEIQNRGKTIIQPFQAIGFEDTAALMNSADDRLINELSLLNQELQPIIIFPTGSGAVKKRIDYVQAGNISSFEAALNNSGEFELGTVRIPANVLVSPVQSLVRPWLKVRIVNGSLISNNDRYVLLVNASDGGTWIAQPLPEQELNLQQDLPSLVREMAFLMLSSEESLQTYGLTRDWEAYRFFQMGVQDIQTYESRHNYDALASAVENFRNAALEDPNFALAYYRLGLVLQQSRQPWQAEDALRMGLTLNPESIPLKNAMAYHLYFFDSYTPLYPSILYEPEKLTDKVKRDKRLQARRLWHQIVTLPASQVLPSDRASAYLGLCNAALDDRAIYIAYFYCFKSHTLLERLPGEQRSLDKVRQADASALNNLGQIIYDMDTSPLSNLEATVDGIDASMEKAIKDSVCIEPDPNKAKGRFFYHRAYAYAALNYYQKALDLQPQNIEIRCNAALAALLVGQDQRMNELDQNAQAHYVLASKYLDRAKRDAKSPSPYYRKALLEYKSAIDLNPTYHEALNGFAYTYWVFRLRWPKVSPDTLEIEYLAKLAAYYADKAFRLAKTQENDSLEVRYRATKAEVSMANGDFQRAREILMEQKIPGSYILDEIRWDLAQSTLCMVEIGNDEIDREELEKEARGILQVIQQHEDMLETYVFSYTGNEYLTNYRLPCRDFISAPE